jgi:hypothetical protein
MFTFQYCWKYDFCDSKTQYFFSTQSIITIGIWHVKNVSRVYLQNVWNLLDQICKEKLSQNQWLSWAQCFQSLTPRARRPGYRCSPIRLDFGLPWFLVPLGLALNRTFCGRFSGLLIMWPAQRNLLVFMTFRAFELLNSLSSSWLFFFL